MNIILTLSHTDHVMRVGDSQVLVEALFGWKKHPIGPDSQVPLSYGSGGIALRFQDLSDGGLIQRQTTTRAWVQYSGVDAWAGLIAACQQGGPEKP